MNKLAPRQWVHPLAPRVVTVALVLLSAGCASIPDPGGGITEVAELVESSSGESVVLPDPDTPLRLGEDEVTRMLAFPLSIKDAERLALSRSPRLRAQLTTVGLAASDLAQASRLRNPGFSLSRFSGNDYEATTLFDLGGAMLMPLRRRIAERQLDQARYRAAEAVVRHVADTRTAWIHAVAESQRTRLMEQLHETMATANTLTGQMSAIGHSPLREIVASELALTEYRANLSRQRVREQSAREVLLRQLGLWGSDAQLVTLPDRLDPPPATPLDYHDVAVQAVQKRLDVEAARQVISATAANHSLSRRSPFINVLELGPSIEGTDEGRDTGFEIELSLPLFDLGGIRNERARIAYQQAVAQAEQVALTAASQARESLHAYQRAFDIARAYVDLAMPLRERLSEEETLRYNGMLISVFDLLEDAADRLAVELRHLDAVRDFWLADTRMKRVLVAGVDTPFAIAAASLSNEDAEAGH